MKHCKQFWVENIKCLDFLKFWPTKGDSKESNYNAGTVLTFYISLLLLIIFRSFFPIYIGITIICIIAIVYYIKFYKTPIPIPPTSKPSTTKPPNSQEIIDTFSNERFPTLDNPFMNVPIKDYDEKSKYKNYQHYAKNPQRPQVQNVRKSIENNFNQDLFQNPSGKFWERINSQRQFYSTPNGQVPNNQSLFAQNLYGHPEGICKSGSIWSRYGIEQTTDSQLCNGWNASTPTGHGMYEDE